MNLSTLNLIKRKFKCCDNLLSVDFTITQAQMSSIGTNSITVIPAVPAGKIIIPIKVFYKTNGTSAYNRLLFFCDQLNQELWRQIDGFRINLNQANLLGKIDYHRYYMQDIYAYQYMQLKIKGDSNPTGGNGNVYIKFVYKLIDNTEEAFFNA